MIPYSIIISSQELNRLIEKEVDFYTSYPIPIIVREYLEKDASVVSHGVYQMEGLSLFVVFNHHLLNEEALQALLKEKEEEINRCEEKCLRKKRNSNIIVILEMIYTIRTLIKKLTMNLC